MAGFSLKTDNLTTSVFERVKVASQAYTIGDAVMLSRTTGGVIPATAATTTLLIYGVAMETVTSAATSLLICVITEDQVWQVTTTDTPIAGDNFKVLVLATKSSVTNTQLVTSDTSTAGIFMQTALVDATNKVIAGKFLKARNITA
jgi:hypothetical protein